MALFRFNIKCLTIFMVVAGNISAAVTQSFIGASGGFVSKGAEFSNFKNPEEFLSYREKEGYSLSFYTGIRWGERSGLLASFCASKSKVDYRVSTLGVSYPSEKIDLITYSTFMIYSFDLTHARYSPTALYLFAGPGIHWMDGPAIDRLSNANSFRKIHASAKGGLGFRLAAPISPVMIRAELSYRVNYSPLINSEFGRFTSRFVNLDLGLDIAFPRGL